MRMPTHARLFGENGGLGGIAVEPSYPKIAKGPALPLPPPTPPRPSPRPKDWCGNCGEDCEWQCRQVGLKCDAQSTTPPHTCECMDPKKPCNSPPQGEGGVKVIASQVSSL